MIRITFTEEDIKALHYWRFHHPYPRVQLKMEALLLKSQNLPHRQISRLLSISENTLCAYFRDFLAGGVEKLKELPFAAPQSVLAEHRETLEAYFREHPPATVKEAAAVIEQRTSVRRGLTQVRHFLKSVGMRRLKVGFVPAKADADEQERFKKANWNRVWRRRGTASGSCTSWTQRISCWRLSWDICGRGSVGSLRRLPANSVSMFWERSMP